MFCLRISFPDADLREEHEGLGNLMAERQTHLCGALGGRGRRYRPLAPPRQSKWCSKVSMQNLWKTGKLILHFQVCNSGIFKKILDFVWEGEIQLARGGTGVWRYRPLATQGRVSGGRKLWLKNKFLLNLSAPISFNILYFRKRRHNHNELSLMESMGPCGAIGGNVYS